jgi:coenzyme PQQ biosynthesis protein C
VSSEILTADAFEARLRSMGQTIYHRHHPFHQRLTSGSCSIDEVRAWALNRFCYQRTIPIKDATILSRLSDVRDRRIWRQRIVDHDGDLDDAPEGGLARWLALTDALGFEREYVVSLRGVLPAVRFACGAYVDFVATRPVLDAVASSLTEMFSPDTIRERVQGMLAHYDFVSPDALAYFRHRLTEAPRDVNFALDYVKANATTAEAQTRVIAALQFKCELLWAQLDAVEHAYSLRRPPPGAWMPGAGMMRTVSCKP